MQIAYLFDYGYGRGTISGKVYKQLIKKVTEGENISMIVF